MIRVAILAALVICLAGRAPARELVRRIGPEDAARVMTLRSTTDLAVLRPVIETFLEGRPETAIVYEQWLSNDLHDRVGAECGAGDRGADLVVSSAVHQMVDLVNRGCALAHLSPETAALPAALNWRDELWGVTSEPVVTIYSRDLVPEGEVPRSRFELLDLLRARDTPYAGRVATYDIEASGLGYLFAYADSLEATTFGALLESFGRVQAIATCCSAEIIGGVLRGDYRVAYNVIGPYAFAAAETDLRLGIVAPADYTLILSRGAMIQKGAAAADLAGAFVDFLLSPPGRAALREAHLFADLGDLVARGAALPDAGQSSLRPIGLSPALLVASDRHKRLLFRDRWRLSFPGAAGEATIAGDRDTGSAASGR